MYLKYNSGRYFLMACRAATVIIHFLLIVMSFVPLYFNRTLSRLEQYYLGLRYKAQNRTRIYLDVITGISRILEGSVVPARVRKTR